MLVKPIVRPIVRAIAGRATDSLGSGFSPSTLFSSGAKGAVYDTSSFVDSASWRRNLLTYSEQFDNAYWTKASATVTANSAVAPDGTTTADTITATAANGYAIPASNIFASAGGNTYTYSVYAKAGTSDVVTLLCAAASTYNATFNLATQVVSSVSANAQASMVSVGSGWFRLILTCNSVANQVYTELQNGRIANGTTIFLWGAQLERGSTATEYQRVTDFNTEFLAAFPQTTLFLDAAGTTAATVNGLVGLQLDKGAANVVARRNLAAYTEDYANAYWNKVAVTIASTTAPDGTSTATTMTATSGPGDRIDRNGIIAGASGTHTYSIYIKRGNTDLVQISLRNSTTATDLAVSLFNVNTGVVSSVIAGTSAIESVGSGWYRCSVTSSGGVTAGNSLRLYAYCGTSSATIGHTASIWGAQLEAGATAGVYQKVVADEGGWLLGNHRYQSTTGSKPILRGSPVGANLVTNGDFASGTGWTTGAGWAIGSGVATATTSSGTLTSTLTATIAKVYRLTYTVTRSAGSVQPSFGGVTGASRSAAGTYVEYLTASSTAALVFTGTTFSGTVDNVEIVDVSAGQVQAPYFLQYDGVDDFLLTAAVDFTATDKMFVCVGVRKLSDAAGIVAELSASITSNTGSFYATAGLDAGNYWSGLSRGSAAATTGQAYGSTTAAGPETIVGSWTHDIAGDQTRMRKNGVLATSALGGDNDKGTGNFGNYALYFGRRGGVSTPYNGLESRTVICGKALSASELASTERWVNQGTGAY